MACILWIKNNELHVTASSSKLFMSILWHTSPAENFLLLMVLSIVKGKVLRGFNLVMCVIMAISEKGCAREQDCRL